MRPNPVFSLLVFCKDRFSEPWECGCSGWPGLMSYSTAASFCRLWQHMRVTWTLQVIKKKMDPIKNIISYEHREDGSISN